MSETLEDVRVDDLAAVRAALAEVDERLAGLGVTSVAEAHRSAIERLERRFEARFEALARVRDAVAELRLLTSPAAMLARAPAALCEGSAFTRAIVSSVNGSAMVAEAVHFAGEPGVRAPCSRRFAPSPCYSSTR